MNITKIERVGTDFLPQKGDREEDKTGGKA